MTRRTYVYDPQVGEMVEKGSRTNERLAADIVTDIEPFKSPIDGTIIASRSELRNHMKRHGVAHVSDYTESHAKAAKDREARINGTHPEVVAERRRQISDAFERVRDERIAKGTWRR